MLQGDVVGTVAVLAAAERDDDEDEEALTLLC